MILEDINHVSIHPIRPRPVIKSMGVHGGGKIAATFIVLTMMLGLIGCAPQGNGPELNVSQADVAQCRYEAQAAVAATPERSLGQMIDKAANQNALQRSCLEARSVTRIEESNNADTDRRDGASRTCAAAGMGVDDPRYSKCFYAVLAGGPVPASASVPPSRKRGAGRTEPVQPEVRVAPAWCSDPQVVNPYLRAECPAPGVAPPPRPTGPQLSRSEAADVCVSRGNASGTSGFDTCLHSILDGAYGPGI